MKAKRPGHNKTRQLRAAKNLAKGLPPQTALVQAGYSQAYAEGNGYRLIKLPAIQSIFTDSCQRIMAKRNLEFDKLLEPYFEALQANVIVRSTQLGDAQEVNLPDHPLRMSAADRLVQLFGGGAKSPQAESEPGQQGGVLPWQTMPLEERLVLREKISAVIREHMATAPKVINGK